MILFHRDGPVFFDFERCDEREHLICRFERFLQESNASGNKAMNAY